MKVVITAQALDDLRVIARWIAEYDEARAATFADELLDKAEGLARSARRYPVAYVVKGREIRKRNYARHLIFFRILDDHIDVLRIVHAKRDWIKILEEIT